MSNKVEKSKVEPKPTITMEEFRERWKKLIEEAKKRAQESKGEAEVNKE